MEHDDGTVESLLERCRADHEAWINGDAAGYEFDDERSSIMGAFGGTALATSITTEGQRRAVAQFQSGSGSVELVQHGVGSEVAFLVMIERATVVFAGRTAPSRWELRVTEVFRRAGDEWSRVHRHADPLVDFHPLDEVLALLR